MNDLYMEILIIEDDKQLAKHIAPEFKKHDHYPTICNMEEFVKNEIHTFYYFLYKLAGVEGFEPPNRGTRTRCLTTWLHPIVGHLPPIID